MIAAPTGKLIPANELLNAANQDADLDLQDKGMSRREINALLHETYASNTLLDFPKSAKHPILERLSDLAQRFLGAVAPNSQDADYLADVTNEALPLLKATHSWTREL